jgi:superoxide reductase
MDRRNFLKAGVGGAAAGVLLPQQLLAGEAPAGMAGGVYYTAENPGRWDKKVSSHLPQMEKTLGADGSVTVKVVTKHGQNGYEHYIVKHQLLDADYRFLAEKMFDPEKEEAESEFTLPDGYKGRLYALSMCNKHDLWLNGMEV